MKQTTYLFLAGQMIKAAGRGDFVTKTLNNPEHQAWLSNLDKNHKNLPLQDKDQAVKSVLSRVNPRDSSRLISQAPALMALAKAPGFATTLSNVGANPHPRPGNAGELQNMMSSMTSHPLVQGVVRKDPAQAATALHSVLHAMPVMSEIPNGGFGHSLGTYSKALVNENMQPARNTLASALRVFRSMRRL